MATAGPVFAGPMFAGPMLKGILLALGFMFLLMLIPIVDFVGIPFGSFIGAYYGMAAVRASTGDVFPPAHRPRTALTPPAPTPMTAH